MTVSPELLRSSEPEPLGRWVRVCAQADLPQGAMTGYEEGETEIMVANVAGRLYATANRCGHMNMPLAQGSLDGQVVTCCLHGARFDVATGRVVQPAPERIMTVKGDQPRQVPQPKTLPLQVYHVKVEAGEVWVQEPDRTQ